MRFSKGIESGKYIIIPFQTLIFDYKLHLVFADNTYFFSLTGHDLWEITDHDRQNAVFDLCKGIYSAKTVTHALLLQIEFYFAHHKELTYLSSNSFECIKSESYVGSWIGQQIRKLEGDGLHAEYVKMAGKLIETKTPA